MLSVIGVNCRFGRSCSTAGSEPSQPFPAFPEIGVFLVGKHTNQNDRPTHREIKRQRNAEQVDEVLKHLQQNHPKHDADDRAFATAERKAAQNRGGDGVEFVKITVRARQNRARVHGKEDRGRRRQHGANCVGREQA